MRYLIYVKIFTILLFCNYYTVIGQEETQSSPLEPGEKIYPIKIGMLSGAHLPLSPAELVNKPTTATETVQSSLLNGLDGLGYGPTINFGIIGKYPFSEKLYLGASIEYSGWNSENSCNCNDNIYKSENSLTMLHFGVFAEYFLYDKFYVSPELSLNLFGVNVSEYSNRGILDFSKSYPRIGGGLGVGYEFPLTDKFTIDISAKGQFPNLLLGKENSGYSESLINSSGETKEAMLFLLSFNLGLLFSL